jgi:ubiquinone/menaquinone biosynthesis C-methylase UbiE
MSFNSSRSDNTFKPKQALTPNPQLFKELVGNGMENLAKAALTQIPHIPTGVIVHDNGCGIGGVSAAVMDSLSGSKGHVVLKATDINPGVLELYRSRAKESDWPASASTMDSQRLDFEDNSMDYSIASALMIFLPNDDVAVNVVKEMYRTLKPGGTLLLDSWAYVPNLAPIQTAAKVTRPPGTPLPRQGQTKWEAPDFVRSMIEKGGFEKEKITLTKVDVYCSTAELTHFATMAWSFIGGTGEHGWLESDEENWDRAIGILVEELKNTNGFKMLDDGRAQIKFVANIAVATK